MEKIVQKERKQEIRKRQLELARELKQPTEDLRLPNVKVPVLIRTYKQACGKKNNDKLMKGNRIPVVNVTNVIAYTSNIDVHILFISAESSDTQ